MQKLDKSHDWSCKLKNDEDEAKKMITLPRHSSSTNWKPGGQKNTEVVVGENPEPLSAETVAAIGTQSKLP